MPWIYEEPKKKNQRILERGNPHTRFIFLTGYLEIRARRKELRKKLLQQFYEKIMLSLKWKKERTWEKLC